MHFKLKFYVLQKRSTAFYVFRNIWKGTQENKSKSIAVPLHKSLVHPHLGNYVLLFSALKRNRTRKKLNRDDQRNASTRSLQMFQGCNRDLKNHMGHGKGWPGLTDKQTTKGPELKMTEAWESISYSSFTPPIPAEARYRDGHLVWASTSTHTGRCPEKTKHWESLTELCLITTIIKA